MKVRLSGLPTFLFPILGFFVIASCELQDTNSGNYYAPLSLKMHKTGSTSGSLPEITYTNVFANEEEHEYDTIAHIPPCSLERNGYPLVAWNTKADYSGVFTRKFGITDKDHLYSTEDDWPKDNEVDLYPVWQEEGTGYVIIPEENNTAKVMLYIGDDATLVMPETIAGRTVTEIGRTFYLSNNHGFSLGGFNTTSIIFPNKLASIEKEAFQYWVELKSVVFPASLLSIGKEAFAYCELVSVYFANKDCNIGNFAFHTSTDLIIHAPAGGTVETYCRDNNITFEAL